MEETALEDENDDDEGVDAEGDAGDSVDEDRDGDEGELVACGSENGGANDTK